MIHDVLAVATREPMSLNDMASSSAVAATDCTFAEASSDADATVTRSFVSVATLDSTRAVASIFLALSAKAPRMPAIDPRNW